MSPRVPTRPDEPGGAAIEAYLDRLFDALGGTGASGRRVLAEAEGHLFDAYDDNLGKGMAEADAAEAAIQRFGRVQEIGATTRRSSAPTPGTIARQVMSAAWVVGAAGLLCLGISGLLGELLGHVAGRAFLAADAPGVIYTPARCAEYFEYAPGAATCSQAAIAHHFTELVMYREAAGVLGLLALGVWWWVIRRRDARWRPPVGVTAIVGAASAGLVALGSAGLGGVEFVFGSRAGFGALFPDAVAAALGTAAFAIVLRRHRRATSRTG